MATLRIEGLAVDVFQGIVDSAFRRDIPIRDEILDRLQRALPEQKRKRLMAEVEAWKLERAREVDPEAQS